MTTSWLSTSIKSTSTSHTRLMRICWHKSQSSRTWSTESHSPWQTDKFNKSTINSKTWVSTEMSTSSLSQTETSCKDPCTSHQLISQESAEREMYQDPQAPPTKCSLTTLSTDHRPPECQLPPKKSSSQENALRTDLVPLTSRETSLSASSVSSLTATTLRSWRSTKEKILNWLSKISDWSTICLTTPWEDSWKKLSSKWWYIENWEDRLNYKMIFLNPATKPKDVEESINHFI